MRTLLGLSLLLTSIAAIAVVTGSCNVDSYCLDCYDAQGTGSVSDARVGDIIDADIRDGNQSDACVVSGIEQCDSLDNDCDGNVDEGDLDGVGIACGNDIGECVSGTTVCQDGSIVCGDGAVTPTFELCNTFDDDCDGNVDENNPQGGLVCGTNAGECQAGVQQCNSGVLECQGQVTGGTESCNGLDDDCDGLFDEGITVAGDCGPVSDAGQCTFGVLTCVGGSIQCVGAVLPQLEQCDAIDHDCDGNPTNGFNFASDPNNCTGCGITCTGANAFMTCNNGCQIAACASGFHNNNGLVSDGCEFGPCNFAGQEICNGADDDCDGNIDEGVNANPPAICDQDGQCAGAVASCNSSTGQFECNYTGNVTAIVAGQFTPETDCDEQDNDCDGRVDEAFALKGAACDDGQVGVCKDSGTQVCNATDNGLVCTAVDVLNPGNAPAETCNGVDDDCNGLVDDGELQEWVTIGAGVEIMKYEASRPDSTAVAQGFKVNGAVCSQAGRLPWTNVTQPQAEAACARIGARLCEEDEWQLACETDNIGAGVQLPAAASSNGLVVFEAENPSFRQNVAGSQASWVEVIVTGASGGNAMMVPDGTQSNTTNQSNLTGSPRMTYTINFTQTGTHFLWVRMATLGDAADSVWFAFDDVDYNINATNARIETTTDNAWLWMNTFSNGTVISFNVAAVGNHTLSFYNREDGVIIDHIEVTKSATYVPLNQGTSEQCEWSYATDCRVYQPNTCNGEDFDGAPAPGDQDVMLATGAMAACFAEWEGGGDAFDLSGNIKEWTAERSAGVNPLRGGSFNNSKVGISCGFDFLTANDSFFLPNIGFRCCR